MARRPKPGPARHTAILILARIAFTAASLVVGYGMFAPPGNGPPLLPWDKAEHFIAFFGLMALGLPAFPRMPLWVLAGGLIAAGCSAEYIQNMPLVHRDADVWDWAGDTLGVLAVVGAVIAAKIRREIGRG
jgi:hypothetical protein